MTEHKPIKVFTNNVECSCGWSSGINKLEDLNSLYVKHLKVNKEINNLNVHIIKEEKVGGIPMSQKGTPRAMPELGQGLA